MDRVSPPEPGGFLLIVDPDTTRAASWARALQQHDPAMPVRQVTTAAATATCDLGRARAVIAPLTLPDATGPALLKRLFAYRADLPVVFVSKPEELATALQTLEGGAYDYLVMAGAYLQALPVIVARCLTRWQQQRDHHRLHTELNGTVRDVRRENEQLQQVVSDLQSAAGTDPLTGLANRRSFGQSLERRFAEAKRHGRDLGCMMLDLDAFKQLNDAQGHPVGDRVLETLGRVLEACCRASDTAGRFGGDEFIVLLPETEMARVERVAQRVRDQFAQAMRAEPQRYGRSRTPTLSIGLTTLNHARAATAEQLVACADRALYQAKHAGGDCLRLYEPHQRASRQSANAPGPAAALAKVSVKNSL
jgi:diguanylate cyclase (GGDEF)-like protein